jgi:hypothetical protein
MSSFNKKILSIPLLLLICIFVPGQKQVTPDQREVWRLRADTITDKLVKDSFNLEAHDRAVLLAQLSDSWWSVDKNRSLAWIEKAVDVISFLPSEDVKANPKKHFQTARKVLSIISDRSKKQSERLIGVLSDADKIFEKDKNLNADSLIDYALATVKENPARAYQTGMLAFRIGEPQEFYKLFWELRRYNPALSDQFFRIAFSNIAAKRNLEIIQGLQLAVFPESFGANLAPNVSASREVKIELLNFLADYISQQQNSYTAKLSAGCVNEAVLVSRLRSQFSELLAAKSPLVQRAIEVCLETQSSNLAKLQADSSSLKKSSIEELLKFADEAEIDSFVRAAYLFKAALSANQQKQYALSIKILERMSDKEREFFADDWDEARYDSAAGQANLQFIENDLSGASDTLKNVPDRIRPMAEVGFVLKTPPDNVSAFGFNVGQLNAARLGFRKSELPFAKKSYYWLTLVKLFSNYKQQGEAADTFKEIVISFNSLLSGDDEMAKDIAANKLASDSASILPTLSPSLLEEQEYSIPETVGLLKAEKPRVAISLAFLKLALNQYKVVAAKVDKNAVK